jgi:hypothetical protein
MKKQLDLLPLFEVAPTNEPREVWQDEWKDMPEFVQPKQEPYATLNVRFRCQEDLEEFARMIGQKLTRKTKSIWHPPLPRGIETHKRWVDES